MTKNNYSKKALIGLAAVAMITLPCTLATAQQQVQLGKLTQHPVEKDSKVIPFKGELGAAKAPGNTYYTENFDGGLNGWTVVTPLGSVDWANTSTGPGLTASTYPVPALNTSTPQGWMMVDDDFLGVSGASTDTRLISPIIDLSAAPAALKVEFDQYFQEFQADTTFVGVSTDGGTTWNEVELNDGVGRDGRPNPELVDVDISTWVAVDPTNVQLRFRYVSTWDYGWQIDNVVITDLPNNDMAILQAHQTAFDFPNSNLAAAPYSIYPATQLQEMVMNAQVKNKGFLPQTNVTFNVDVNGPGGPAFNGSSTPQIYAPGATENPQIVGFTPDGTVGTYTVGYTVTQTEVDEIPGDNATSNSFEVSADMYGMDDGASDGSTNQGANNVGDQFELGNFFEMVNETYVTEIQVAVDDQSVVGSAIYGVIYDATIASPLAITADYTLQAGDLTSIGGANFVTIPVQPPFQTTLGEAYCIMVGHYGGADDVLFSTSGSSVEQVSIIRYPNTDENFFVTRSPMVRARVQNDIGIEETIFGTSNVTFQPNPFTQNTVMSFELTSAEAVSLEIMDMTGRVVMAKNLGRLAAGRNTMDLSGNDLSSGAYTWRLVAGTAARTGKLVRK